MAMVKKEIPRKNTQTVQGPHDRRRFLNKIWLALGILALVEILAIVISFLRPRKPSSKAGEFGTLMEAGRVESFAPGSVTAFPRGQFYLVCLEDGGFLALSRRCTHLGCTVPWDSEKRRFLCPCHASAYDMKGDVLKSPAARAMDLFGIRIDNNTVFVDTGKIIRRSAFQPDQVSRPA